ncbi:TusE/DsrC/DsvC family sulfur relay protein [Chloroflexota bacterium]
MGEQSMPRDMQEPDEDEFVFDANKWKEEVVQILARNEFKLSNSEQRGNKVMEQQIIPSDMPELDEDGFMVDVKKWTEEVAQILAQNEVPTGLTENHWIVIGYIREYYLEYRSAPPIRMIARRTGFSLRRLKELFPKGLLNTAWRYAGLPRNVVRPHFMYPRGDSWK